MIKIDESDFATARFKDEIFFCNRLRQSSDSQIKTIVDEFLQHVMYNMLIYLIVTHLDESPTNAGKLIAPAEKAVKKFLENQLTQ